MASQIPLILILQELQRIKKRKRLRDFVLSLDELPPELICRPNNVETMKQYILKNNAFGKFSEEHCGLLVNDLQEFP